LGHDGIFSVHAFADLLQRVTELWKKVGIWYGYNRNF